jgi:hypothetical protein
MVFLSLWRLQAAPCVLRLEDEEEEPGKRCAGFVVPADASVGCVSTGKRKSTKLCLSPIGQSAAQHFEGNSTQQASGYLTKAPKNKIQSGTMPDKTRIASPRSVKSPGGIGVGRGDCCRRGSRGPEDDRPAGETGDISLLSPTLPVWQAPHHRNGQTDVPSALLRHHSPFGPS